MTSHDHLPGKKMHEQRNSSPGQRDLKLTSNDLRKSMHNTITALPAVPLTAGPVTRPAFHSIDISCTPLVHALPHQHTESTSSLPCLDLTSEMIDVVHDMTWQVGRVFGEHMLFSPPLTPRRPTKIPLSHHRFPGI